MSNNSSTVDRDRPEAWTESLFGNGGIGTKCAENHHQEKMCKNPKVKYFRNLWNVRNGMPRSNFPRSNGKIKMEKCQGRNISGMCGMCGMCGM